MAKLSQIRRLAILINKLSAVRYVPTDALVAHVENTLALYDNKDSNYSQRTMQRDFGLIDEMFGIVIRNDKSRGYYIAELDEMTDNYKELLLNFESAQFYQHRQCFAKIRPRRASPECHTARTHRSPPKSDTEKESH